MKITNNVNQKAVQRLAARQRVVVNNTDWQSRIYGDIMALPSADPAERDAITRRILERLLDLGVLMADD